MSGNIFFIGDLHLGHEGIMKFGQRQFESIGEHDAHLLQQWNSVVRRQRDLVWLLGDVAMNMEAIKLLAAFNGRKVLVMGNHDRFDMQVYLKYFERVVACEKRYHGMIMTHIPIHPNELQYRTWKWNIHGHCHHAEKAPEDPRYFNVNADVRDLTPVSLEQLKLEIQQREDSL